LRGKPEAETNVDVRSIGRAHASVDVITRISLVGSLESTAGSPGRGKGEGTGARNELEGVRMQPRLMRVSCQRGRRSYGKGVALIDGDDDDGESPLRAALLWEAAASIGKGRRG